MNVAFIDQHRETYGVEPICRVLTAEQSRPIAVARVMVCPVEYGRAWPGKKFYVALRSSSPDSSGPRHRWALHRRYESAALALVCRVDNGVERRGAGVANARRAESTISSLALDGSRRNSAGVNPVWRPNAR
jgi:hypothetical protein